MVFISKERGLMIALIMEGNLLNIQCNLLECKEAKDMLYSFCSINSSLDLSEWKAMVRSKMTKKWQWD